MLKELTVKNFKLFDETGVTLQTGRITVLIGANGTGKSSVLQALLILKQSRQPPYTGVRLRLDGPLLPAGSFQDIVHGRDDRRAISIALTVQFQWPPMTPTVDDGLERGEYAYTMTAQRLQTTQILQTEEAATITLSNGTRVTTAWDPQQSQRIVNPPTLRVDGAEFGLDGLEQVVGRPIRISSQARGAERETARLDAVLNTMADLLEHYYLIPAIRGFDQINYGVWEGEQPGDLTAAGGAERQAALVANALGARPEVADQVSGWLNTILHLPGRQLRPRTDRGRISGEMVGDRKATNVFHEAFGLNQLVAPLLWLSAAPSGALVAIEEPEIHLHPRAQAALCDVFVEAAVQEQKQLMLTTHSEHILMGFLTAVAQGRLDPSDLAVYEFQRIDDAARAERLAVSRLGQIEGGLGEFLEVDKEEIGELIKARLG